MCKLSFFHTQSTRKIKCTILHGIDFSHYNISALILSPSHMSDAIQSPMLAQTSSLPWWQTIWVKWAAYCLPFPLNAKKKSRANAPKVISNQRRHRRQCGKPQATKPQFWKQKKMCVPRLTCYSWATVVSTFFSIPRNFLIFPRRVTYLVLVSQKHNRSGARQIHTKRDVFLSRVSQNSLDYDFSSWHYPCSQRLHTAKADFPSVR